MGIITPEISLAGRMELRRRSLEEYYSNPNHCKFCGVMILVRAKQKASETKEKQFCSKSCAAKYNNRCYPKRVAQQRYCRVCGKEVPAKRVICDDCLPAHIREATTKGRKSRLHNNGYNDWSNIDQLTKQEVYDRSKNWWTAKAIITRNARNKYMRSDKPK